MKPRPVHCLVLGLGAVGTYVGARMAAAGHLVTFLMRPGKAKSLAGATLQVTLPERTLTIKNFHITDRVTEPAEAVVLACKSFHLPEAINAVRPAVGKATIVLPFLNGMAHIEALDTAFDPAQVWGGVAHFSAVKVSDTHVQRVSTNDILITGPRSDAPDGRITRLWNDLQATGMEARLSAHIVSDMWEKWVFIVTLAGLTSLMRGTVGDIVAQPGGADVAHAMFEEAAAVAHAAGHTLSEKFFADSKALLTRQGSPYKASLARDVEAGRRTEVDHLMVDFGRVGKSLGVSCPLLDLATLHVRVHEGRAAAMASPVQ